MTIAPESVVSLAIAVLALVGTAYSVYSQRRKVAADALASEGEGVERLSKAALALLQPYVDQTKIQRERILSLEKRLSGMEEIERAHVERIRDLESKLVGLEDENARQRALIESLQKEVLLLRKQVARKKEC